MKQVLVLAVLLWQAAPGSEPPVAQPQHLRYQRALTIPAAPALGAGQACAVLDAGIFPHAAPSLRDLRIFPAQSGATMHEVPYAITLSETVTEETQAATVLNLGKSGNDIVFDLEMPERAYTEVMLDLGGADFIATARVSGTNELGGRGKSTALGTFTLFDLSSQRLSRDTTLPLQESTFRYLHVALAVTAAPGSKPAGPFTPDMISGAQVPPSRVAEVIYSPVVETKSLAAKGRESHANFVVPARIPIERITFLLAPSYKGNFSRDIRISAVAQPESASGTSDANATASSSRAAEDIANDSGDRVAAPPEMASGTILRVHATEAGHDIRTEQLSIPAILGANLQHPAKVDIAIENGDDQPLPIAAVRLEMRERKLCFDAPSDGPSNPGLTLFYGDASLAAPVYDYARLFTAATKPLGASLGPEAQNPTYQPESAALRPFTERHPELLWIALLAVVSALGIVAIKASQNVGKEKV
jgi:hypothetical protein